ERAQFIIDMDIEGMTKQELRQAVNERTQTLQEKDRALLEKKQALQENEYLQKAVEDESSIITELTTELANLKVQLENVKTSKAELDQTARQLKDSLESLQKSTSAKGYERMKTNFINTSLKVRANHIAFLCENLNKTIKEVKHEMLQIAPNDKETYIIYKNKVYDLLNVWLKDETWSRQACPGEDGQ
ncbi:MAG: preprotein translocase subunit SecA, partial [Desulfitobacterium hafniense]|nr:preprotein translocase subunit SecA [Desulfitobacterium hafniense]